MTMNANEINAVVSLSKKAISLLGVLDFEDESFQERRAIEAIFGAGSSAPDFRGDEEASESWREFRETWAQLVKSCGGNKALAAEVVGRDLDDVEYYL